MSSNRSKTNVKSGKATSNDRGRHRVDKPVRQRASADGQTGPPPVPAAPDGPPQAATDLFEGGMLALQRHDFGRATGIFTALLAGFPGERALADRARVYLELCRREIATRSGAPQTVEERLTAATAALNNADETAAEHLVRAVLAEIPEHDLALYLLATVEVRRGMTDAALQYLSQAVAVNPEAATQARHDPDFDVLRGSGLFAELTDSPPGGSRPPRRRPRAER